MYVLGLAAGTLPTGAISRAYGRRTAFIIGAGCGTLTGLLAAFAVLHSSFWLFCFATFLGGLAVLSFASFAKRRAQLRAVDEFPDHSI
jgi:MFS family permease